MARKKHKKHEEHVDESWLVPYSDMLTLLMALFIVLFAMGSMDASKFKQLAVSFNDALQGGTGDQQFLSTKAPQSTDDLKEQIAQQQKQIADLQFTNADVIKAKQQMQQQLAEMENLKKIQADIDAYIQKNNLQLSLKTNLTSQGLMITILDNALFDSGKAEIKPQSLLLATQISNLLSEAMPRQVMISGHTDNQPINNSEFQSNWDLSTKRAVNFLRVILTNTKLNPEKFDASGYGEYHPVASNDTKEGKAKNRRVEVLILPETTNFNPNNATDTSQ